MRNSDAAPVPAAVRSAMTDDQGAAAAWRLASGANVLLSQRALEHMEVFRQIGDDASEAGGILIGRVLLASGDILVDHATKPTVQDQRSRFRFLRARESAQQIVDEAWAQSDGSQIYLGEWHTHPEDTPSPSWWDRCNWRHIARCAKYEQDALLFLIVGRVNIGAWETTRNGTIFPLSVS